MVGFQTPAFSFKYFGKFNGSFQYAISSVDEFRGTYSKKSLVKIGVVLATHLKTPKIFFASKS